MRGIGSKEREIGKEERGWSERSNPVRGPKLAGKDKKDRAQVAVAAAGSSGGGGGKTNVRKEGKRSS